MSCAWGLAEQKRKVVVRDESADTHEYEANHTDGMDGDMGESKEELSFVPSAVSDRVQRHEPQFRCDR